jgi:spectrin beta
MRLDHLWNVIVPAVVSRFESLAEPATIRRDNLEDALLMYQYYRDVEDELSWIQEKLPVASSTDLGNSLNEVQNLVKKHQVQIILLLKIFF